MSFLGMSRGEIIFVVMILAMIFGWMWIPRLGERLGALTDKR